MTKGEKCKPRYPYRDLLEVCICGHGKVHHNGKYAECTCDIGQYKNQHICNCPNYEINLNDSRNILIMKCNEELSLDN